MDEDAREVMSYDPCCTYSNNSIFPHYCTNLLLFRRLIDVFLKMLSPQPLLSSHKAVSVIFRYPFQPRSDAELSPLRGLEIWNRIRVDRHLGSQDLANGNDALSVGID